MDIQLEPSGRSKRSSRDRFTPEQIKRVRTYLEQSTVLQGMQVKTVEMPGGTLSNPSGKIIVEQDEYVVNSTLEMLPGATIRVKPGARLKVQSTITGACGKMWQGIIVEGDPQDETQDPAYQGQVTVLNGGKIEHAQIGIDVQDPDVTDYGTGGGIVYIQAFGLLENNTVGIRFGEYTEENKSYLISPRFAITDNYRGGTARPVFMELNTVKGLFVRLGLFRDLRTQCPDPYSRAIGIDSRNSGFRVSLSTQFENLSTGNRAAVWKNCRTGLSMP